MTQLRRLRCENASLRAIINLLTTKELEELLIRDDKQRASDASKCLFESDRKFLKLQVESRKLLEEEKA